MKKIVFFAALLMTACGGRSGVTNDVSSDNVVSVSDSEELTDTAKVEPVKKQSQADFLREWKEQGVTAFEFNRDGYLVYTIAEANLNADPDWVAQQYYEIAANVEGIKGCIVVNYADKELGRYER